MSHPFLSSPATIELVNIFQEPYNNAVATARTCYASKIIDVDNVKGVGLPPDKQAQREAQRDRIAESTYKAGHHTTLQHTHVQFAMSNVSRHFLWSFLHASPFYNSEQQSQRYVHMRGESVIIPQLKGEALHLYQETLRMQVAAYEQLTEMLKPVAASFYFGIFPARRKHEKYHKEVQKKAQEVARYVLPIGTFANLYHTVSLLTLLRYHHMANQFDVPTETRWVVDQMVAAVKAHDPLLAKVMEEPLPLEEMPETHWWQTTVQQPRTGFLARFDASLDGKVSRLIDYKANQEAVMAEAVREVLGLLPEQMSDREALERVLHPNHNPVLHTTLNTSTHSKLTRVLHHASYTFRKKISHSADSQDQRHRMVPGSRPVLGLHLSDTPDYITPRLLPHDEASLKVYQDTMARTWEAVHQLLGMGVSLEDAAYLLPNAVSVRFSESGDLLNLHHKLKARLCYNAQEEIWQASLDELEQITAVNPTVGSFLLPPCGLRQLGAHKPFCPEGDRYCGVPVWRLQPQAYARVL